MRNYNKTKRTLVTGGSGFLGSHLIDRLIANGNDVVCLDNFFTGTKANIDHLLDSKKFELLRHDITQPVFLEVDEIYNLASPASPIHYQYDPIHTLKTNVMGAMNIAGLARRIKAPIFHASTSEVYGDPLVHPQTEDYWGNVNPVGIRSCYDEGKRCAETILFDHHRQYAIDIRIGRIFNTYGPRMHPNDGRVVSNFIMQALNDENITIFGSGNQTRSFCYVDDLIEGFLRFMSLDSQNDNFPRVMNLGNPVEFSIMELAEMVIDLTGSQSKIIFYPLPSDDPKQRKPDISIAHANLQNWSPKVQLREGILKTINYFDQLLIKAA